MNNKTKTNGYHKVVKLSANLAHVDKEKLLANIVRAKLGLLGYTSATPEPDTGGHDLWFAKPRTLEIFRCQLKAFCRYQLSGDCVIRGLPDQERAAVCERFASGDCGIRGLRDQRTPVVRQYDQNVEVEWFLRALHQPLFLFVLGLAEHEGRVCSMDFKTPHLNTLDRTISDFHVGFVPGSLFRGWEYKLGAKKKRRAVNIHARLEPGEGEDKKITLYSDKFPDEPGRTYFTENVTQYSDTPAPGMSKCVGAEAADSSRVGTWRISPLAKVVTGRRGKNYTHKVQCECCKTVVLFPDSDTDLVQGVVNEMKEKE